jgi:hypothetical protein
VRSSGSLLAGLATVCLTPSPPAGPALPGFRLVTTHAPLQRHALDLPGVSHRLGGAQSAARPAQPEQPGKRAPAPVTGGDFGVA